jgi:hypothetical protein
MSDGIDTLALLTLTTRLLCAGVALQSIEVLANFRELRDEGLLGWRESRGRLFGPNGKLLGLHTWPVCLLIFGIRTLAAIAALALSFDTTAMPYLLAVLVGTQAYYNHRLKMVHEGSDSMFLLGLVAVLGAAIEPSEPRLRAAALLFLTAQVLLAYFAAGWDKVRAPAWRNGTLLMRALRYGAHRFEPLGDMLARRPAFAVALSWGVILIELLFPLSAFLPPPAFWIFVCAGVIFHAGVAFFMGLHGFFWSFTAAYPAIYFANRQFTGPGNFLAST